MLTVKNRKVVTGVLVRVLAGYIGNGRKQIFRKKIPTKGCTQKNILAQTIARKTFLFA